MPWIHIYRSRDGANLFNPHRLISVWGFCSPEAGRGWWFLPLSLLLFLFHFHFQFFFFSLMVLPLFLSLSDAIYIGVVWCTLYNTPHRCTHLLFRGIAGSLSLFFHYSFSQCLHVCNIIITLWLRLFIKRDWKNKGRARVCCVKMRYDREGRLLFFFWRDRKVASNIPKNIIYKKGRKPTWAMCF